MSNLEIAQQLGAIDAAANGTAKFGVTYFSDLTPEEFQSTYLAGPLSNIAPLSTTSERRFLKSSNTSVLSSSRSRSLRGQVGPVPVDWSDCVNYPQRCLTTPIKNQGIAWYMLQLV